MRRDHGPIEVLDDAMATVLRAKTPAEKIAMIAAAHRTVRLLAAASVRYQHPDWTEEQIQAAAVKRVAHGAG